MRANKIRDPKRRKYCEENPTAYGSDFYRSRRGRSHRRPISNVQTMNLTLRSTQAKGEWSFRNEKNWRAISANTAKFAERFRVQVIRLSNVGNHLHFHVRFPEKKAYVKFIRALTAAIAMAITGRSRWLKVRARRFWDLRPFTRVLQTTREVKTFDNYLNLNDLEGDGFLRGTARWILRIRNWARGGGHHSPPERFVVPPSA